MNWLRDLGLSTRKQLMNWGYGARLFLRLLALLPSTLKRPALLRDQIHFLGNYSLAIIAVSGLFVGFVLALQGYYILSRFGATEAVGLMVALSLLRELGPVVTALLFAGRAGTSLTAEIGMMKSDEVLDYMEMTAVNPVARVLAPRFWAGVVVMPLLAAIFGFAVTFIAVLQGFNAQATPEGVSRATTRTVVMASLTVLALDFLLTALMFSI